MPRNESARPVGQARVRCRRGASESASGVRKGLENGIGEGVVVLLLQKPACHRAHRQTPLRTVSRRTSHGPRRMSATD